MKRELRMFRQWCRRTAGQLVSTPPLGRRHAAPKVFCIGRNKTGTTSMGEALRSLGFRLGNQAQAELLLEPWARRDFSPIVAYCRTADAFQDIPFSLDYTYQALDASFPGSKFILTVRNSAQEWYDSLTRFHTQIVGAGRLPTPDDLKRFPYRRPGWLWRNHLLVYGVDEASLYDPAIYKAHYERHTTRALDYFRHRPEDLLVLNVSDPASMDRLCDFLGMGAPGRSFPHLNRSGGIARGQ